MILYITAPHSNWFQEAMNLYLAGAASSGNNWYLWKNNKPNETMNVFLAGLHAENKRANSESDFSQKIFVLESFHYITDWMKPYIANHWNFMLDSGAFTFMGSSKGEGVDWDEYVERYAAFINEMNIDLFFELDIDELVGLKEVERLRAKLEKLTGKQSIPVWHYSRGKEYWLKMSDEYSYIAIGGMAANLSYRKKLEPFFPWFIDEARKRGAKVHALGYTSIEGLKKYRFHSVDSTAWLYGNRGGFIYHFNGQTVVKIHKPESRLKGKPGAIHNFREWVKFQKYAINNL